METGRKWRDIQTVGRRVVVAGRRFTLPEQRKLETIRPSVFLAWRNDLFFLFSILSSHNTSSLITEIALYTYDTGTRKSDKMCYCTDTKFFYFLALVLLANSFTLSHPIQYPVLFLSMHPTGA